MGNQTILYFSSLCGGTTCALQLYDTTSVMPFSTLMVFDYLGVLSSYAASTYLTRYICYNCTQVFEDRMIYTSTAVNGQSTQTWSIMAST